MKRLFLFFLVILSTFIFAGEKEVKFSADIMENIDKVVLDKVTSHLFNFRVTTLIKSEKI